MSFLLGSKFDLGFFRDLPTPMSLPVSGGRSSALLAWAIVEANGGLPAGVVANFQNTSLELPETYIFIDRLNRFLGLNLTYLEWNPWAENSFEIVGPNSLKREGEIFETLLTYQLLRRDLTVGVRPLPNPVQRTCTANLKTKTAHRYFRRHHGWAMNYHVALGYRWDEQSRVKRRQKLDLKGGAEGGIGNFPLYEAEIDSEDVYFTWRDHAPFDLGIDSELGNCDFCFMKSAWKIKEQMVRYPERALRWIAWEKRAELTDRPGLFRKDRPSFAQLWQEVQDGNMQSPGDPEIDKCGTCGI